MNIRAIIYDMDGVIIDSEPMWQQAERKVFADVGLELTISDCSQTKGMRIDEVVDFWFRQRPWDQFGKQEIVDSILNELIELIQAQGVRMSGVQESIRYFINQRMPLAIATSSPIRVMDAILSKLEIEQKFDVLCSAENEPFGKPHPAVYLTTAKKLNVRPDECLVIEDSIAGMVSAKAAKMNVIVVPEKSEFDMPEWNLANYKLKSLNEVEHINLF